MISSKVNLLQQRFAQGGVDCARRVAEELLADLLDCRPLEIYLQNKALSADQEKMLEQKARRIEQGEPLQYVVGKTDFFGLEFLSDPRALIPRPETELLVEEILASSFWSAQELRIVEVGTGSGCIVTTLAVQRPNAKYTAIDCSASALELAKENAARHGVESVISWRQQSLLEHFPPNSFDVLVANLPYIPTEQWKTLASSVRDYEPRGALEGGSSGLELIEQLLEQAKIVLAPSGWVFLEFGFDQGSAVKTLLEKTGFTNIAIKKDLAGHDRMGIGQWPECI
jgi:release factor glutamine methyltransferase